MEKKSRTRIIVFAALFILIGALAGLVVSSGFNWVPGSHSGERGISGETIDLLARIDSAISEVATAVKPAVVNISSTTTVRVPGWSSPFGDDPFFRHFFGDQFRSFGKPRNYKQSGLGSGVIVDKDGYILTNHHVIKDADEIKVTLSNQKVYKARVVGSDPKTDLAVLKIGESNLPVIRIGNSDELKVGARVIAIGNPFGLNQTVTTGIISAKGRADVGIADYEDFLQTDAPINPGNSGGALVNIRGELIGINTAILSSSGGYQGIGLAIPSNMAKAVMDSLIKKGKIVRGWLGISIQPITPDLAREFGLKEEKGVLVADVTQGGPAEQAGLRQGDAILEFDGKEAADPARLKNMVANTPPGKEVQVKYARDGKFQSTRVTVRELPEPDKFAAAKESALKGVAVQNLTPEIRSALGLPKKIAGVIVAGVDEDSPAADILARGDVILEINRQKVGSLQDFRSALSGVKPGQKVLIRIYRNGTTMYLTL